FSGSGLTYSYQWRRCDAAGANCADIGGATSSSYTTDANDLGKTIRAVVTARNGGGSASATSAPTATVVAVAVLDDTMTATHRPLSIAITTRGGRCWATATFSGNDVPLRLWIATGAGTVVREIKGGSPLSLTGLNLGAGSYTVNLGGGITTDTAVHLTTAYVP